jgi:hypothetical protein
VLVAEAFATFLVCFTQETIEISFDGKDNFDSVRDVEKYPATESLSSKTFGKCFNIF